MDCTLWQITVRIQDERIVVTQPNDDDRTGSDMIYVNPLQVEALIELLRRARVEILGA